MTIGFMKFAAQRLQDNYIFLALPSGESQIVSGKHGVTPAMLDECFQWQQYLAERALESHLNLVTLPTPRCCNCKIIGTLYDLLAPGA